MPSKDGETTTKSRRKETRAPAKELNTSNTPKSAEVMEAILSSMGVSDYHPRVINQLLEFTYRYTADVLQDANAYANHAGRKAINVDDVKLSVQTQINTSFSAPPPREFLVETAENKNTIALPPISMDHCGILLPNERSCLTAVNYQLNATKIQSAPPSPLPSVPSSVAIPSHIAQMSNSSLNLNIRPDAIENIMRQGDRTADNGFVIVPLEKKMEQDDDDYDM